MLIIVIANKKYILKRREKWRNGKQRKRRRKVSHLLDKILEEVIHKALMKTDPVSICHTLQ